MPSINNSRPVISTPSADTGAASATRNVKGDNLHAATTPKQDQFDASQTSTPFQQSINQEILPDNRGEMAHKGAHRKKADDAQNPVDPAELLVQPGVMPKP